MLNNEEISSEINSVVQEIPMFEETKVEPLTTVVYDNIFKIIRGYYYVGVDASTAFTIKDSLQHFLDSAINKKYESEILSVKVLKFDRVSALDEVVNKHDLSTSSGSLIKIIILI